MTEPASADSDRRKTSSAPQDASRPEASATQAPQEAPDERPPQAADDGSPVPRVGAPGEGAEGFAFPPAPYKNRRARTSAENSRAAAALEQTLAAVGDEPEKPSPPLLLAVADGEAPDAADDNASPQPAPKDRKPANPEKAPKAQPARKAKKPLGATAADIPKPVRSKAARSRSRKAAKPSKPDKYTSAKGGEISAALGGALAHEAETPEMDAPMPTTPASAPKPSPNPAASDADESPADAPRDEDEAASQCEQKPNASLKPIDPRVEALPPGPPLEAYAEPPAPPAIETFLPEESPPPAYGMAPEEAAAALAATAAPEAPSPAEAHAPAEAPLSPAEAEEIRQIRAARDFWLPEPSPHEAPWSTTGLEGAAKRESLSRRALAAAEAASAAQTSDEPADTAIPPLPPIPAEAVDIAELAVRIAALEAETAALLRKDPMDTRLPSRLAALRRLKAQDAERCRARLARAEAFEKAVKAAGLAGAAALLPTDGPAGEGDSVAHAAQAPEAPAAPAAPTAFRLPAAFRSASAERWLRRGAACCALALLAAAGAGAVHWLADRPSAKLAFAFADRPRIERQIAMLRLSQSQPGAPERPELQALDSEAIDRALERLALARGVVILDKAAVLALPPDAAPLDADLTQAALRSLGVSALDERVMNEAVKAHWFTPEEEAEALSAAGRRR